MPRFPSAPPRPACGRDVDHKHEHFIVGDAENVVFVPVAAGVPARVPAMFPPVFPLPDDTAGRCSGWPLRKVRRTASGRVAVLRGRERICQVTTQHLLGGHSLDARRGRIYTGDHEVVADAAQQHPGTPQVIEHFAEPALVLLPPPHPNALPTTKKMPPAAAISASRTPPVSMAEFASAPSMPASGIEATTPAIAREPGVSRKHPSAYRVIAHHGPRLSGQRSPQGLFKRRVRKRHGRIRQPWIIQKNRRLTGHAADDDRAVPPEKPI